jgi:phosphatidate cytidylyltransferase
MSNLAQRILTAAVLVPVLVLAMFFDDTGLGVIAIVAVAGVIAVDEFLRMAWPVGPQDRAAGVRFGAAMVTGGILVGVARWGPGTVLPPALAAGAGLLSGLVLLRRDHLRDAGRQLAVAWSGLLYVPVLLCVLPLFRRDFGSDGGPWLFVTLALAFGSDTMAYAFGRLFGRHKLYAAVSPGKTVEGAFGGLVGGAAATLGFGTSWLLPGLSVRDALVLGVVGSVLGQLGDLVESMLKRTFGVKDSGAILPGHGGMLDRIDALLFVCPFVYWYATLVAR